jgi:hypothetical protein
MRTALPEVITFYSYKGGAGRSMALVNIACLLAERTPGDVLIVDWDLEAPGLDRFVAGHVLGVSGRDGMDDTPGVLDLFQELEEASRPLAAEPDEDTRRQILESVALDRHLVPLDVPSLYFMKAGRFDESYGARVSAFPWEQFYRRQPWLLPAFASLLTSRFDYVLVDSRTGLSDTSGICTTLLPSKLVVAFTPNWQSLTGTIDRVRRSAAFRRESPDVRPLTVFPLPSRIDLSEDRLRRRWRFGDPLANVAGYQPLFERLFEDIYDMRHCDLGAYFDAVQLQHVPVYAYGEEIAVLDDAPSDRLSLANSYREFCNRLVEPAPWIGRERPETMAFVPPTGPPVAAIKGTETRRVFLSHTSELRAFPQERSFVAAAEEAVLRTGLRVSDMAYFAARDQRPAQYCLEAIARSDVYVGIVGFRYGSTVLDRPDVSYVELEFERATELGIPRLIFLLDEEGLVPLPARHLQDLENGVRQAAFRSRLRDADVTVAQVTTPQQLEFSLHGALMELRRLAQPVERPPHAAPFMAPRLSRTHVERRELSVRLADLLEGQEPITVGLCGEAGAGKTTLATSLCHQVRDRFPGGVLWVTLGEKVGSSELLAARINDLAATLSGQRPDFSGTEAAGAFLGRLLEQDRRLLVVDDVRTMDQLVPFLQGACMRVVTTRDRSLLPDDAIAVRVGGMTEAESLELLARGLEAEAGPELDELSRRTGGSPSLLLAAWRAVRDRHDLGASVELAAAHVEACLARGGPEALDSPLARATLRLLEDGRPERLERYLELAVFPEDVIIPLATLSMYWGMDEPEAMRLGMDLADHGLIERPGPAGIRLRDVLRVSERRMARYHRRLLDAHRMQPPPAGSSVATAWWTMSADEPYMWRYLTHHLREAGRRGGPEHAELEALLGDDRWTTAQALYLAGASGHVLRGHATRVRAVAISPDGSWLASGDANGTILLWNSADGSHRSTLVGHSGAVNALAISPDGTWLASASSDYTLRIWDVVTGTSRALFGHFEYVNSVAISPDGAWLASGSMDRTVRLWDARDGANRATAYGHSGPVWAVAISPDGPWLLSAGDDWVVLRRASDAAPLSNLTRSLGVIQLRRYVAISPDGSWLLCNGRGTAVRLLNVNGTPRATLAGHGSPINAVAISADGAWIVSAADDGTVRVWSALDGTLRRVFTGHQGAVNAVAFSPGGSWLASAGDDGTVRLWRALPEASDGVSG